MYSKNLVICDPEEGYAQALAMYVMQRKELAVQVQVCRTIAQLLKLSQKTEVHLLLISDELKKEDRKQAAAEKKFLLGSHAGSALQEGEIWLYKYQSGERIVEELIRECGFEDPDQGIFCKSNGKKQGRVIGIFSPVHRVGKTSYALRLGEEMAVSENVLYLNLEIYGGIGGHFEEGEQTLSDVLYYARQEKGNLGLLLTTVVRHRKKLDYVLPVSVAEDMKNIRAEEWIELIRRILEQSIYDVLILDIDEGLPEVYRLLQACTEIHMPWVQGCYPQAKLRQFEREASVLGYEDLLQKIVRKEQYDQGRTAACKDPGGVGPVERG
ncbi:hypothetical protein AALA13_06025 [Lachnospiraceae bacterium 50-23]